MNDPTTPISGATNGAQTRRAGRPTFLVIGVLLALLGMPFLLGGLGLGWALATQRDDQGFFTTPTARVTSSAAALTTTHIDLGNPGPDSWWADRDLATVRLRASSADGSPVFLGLAPSEAVEGYLGNAPYDEVSDVTDNPFGYTLTRRGGADALPAPPEAQDFWTLRASGTGTQELVWDLEPGTYTAVIMNANGTQGVDVELTVGGRLDLLGPLTVGLLVGGLVLIAAGAVLIIYGAGAGGAGSGPQQPSLVPVQGGSTATGPQAVPASPVTLTGIQDAHLNRALWLVKWLLALPHLLILAVLWGVFVVLTVVAFVAILVTGRYPRGLFEVNVGVLRWSWRVHFYATGALGTDRYPPFRLSAGDYPADLEVAYPQRLSRGLVLVKSWLLALPHLIVLAVLAGTWGWTTGNDGARLTMGGLIGALTLAAGLLLLFTGRYPSSLFDLLVGLNRWVYRVIAYVALMTDEYPPFRLDQGPTEPPQPAETEPGPRPDGGAPASFMTQPHESPSATSRR